MRLIYSCLIPFLIYSYSFAETQKKYFSIEELVQKGVLKASFKGLGGHSGDCIQLNLENPSNDSVFIWVEAGRRLGSKDTSEQDIFLTQNRQIALAPLQKDSLNLEGYCCQSSKAGPKIASLFTIGAMAPTLWVKFANFLDKNKFPKEAVQAAVWVLSDGHDLASIHAEDDKAIIPLRRELAKLLNRPIPWYSFTYKEAENGVFSNEIEEVHGEIKFSLSSNAVITIFIQDEFGYILHYIIPEMNMGPGDYVLEVDTEIAAWEPGEYTIWIYQDYNVPLKKQTFFKKQ